MSYWTKFKAVCCAWLLPSLLDRIEPIMSTNSKLHMLALMESLTHDITKMENRP